MILFSLKQLNVCIFLQHIPNMFLTLLYLTALNQLVDLDTPEGICKIISDTVDVIMVILQNQGREGSADNLVPMLTLVLARSQVFCIKSILSFVSDFLDPAKMTGQQYYCYVSLVTANEYVQMLNPGSFIVRCRLNDIDVPERMKPLIDTAKYNNVLKPLREALFANAYKQSKVKQTRIWSLVGIGIASPVAIAVGLLTAGTGVPFSLYILAAAGLIGAGAGTFAHYDEIKKKVNTVNKTLESSRISIMDPFLTNRINRDSDFRDFNEIEWLVSTLEQ